MKKKILKLKIICFIRIYYEGFSLKNYDHWTKTVFWIHFLKTYHYFEIMKKLYIAIPVCGKNTYIKMQGNDKHN